jgi:hypothetical protein
LNSFLNNRNATGYDWRNAINATRSLALGIAEFGSVGFCYGSTFFASEK